MNSGTFAQTGGSITGNVTNLNAFSASGAINGAIANDAASSPEGGLGLPVPDQDQGQLGDQLDAARGGGLNRPDREPDDGPDRHEHQRRRHEDAAQSAGEQGEPQHQDREHQRGDQRGRSTFVHSPTVVPSKA